MGTATRILSTLAVLAVAMPVQARGASPADAPPDAETVLRQTGVRAGLAVHLGATDGRLEVALANDGRILVHALALDEQSLERTRRAIRDKGLYGLASAERADSLASLPYADNLVNLLVADLGRLAREAPAPREILRVLAPGGAAYLKRGGRWSATVKPRPADIDDWTHFDHGPEGNGVSRDRRVRPPSFVQWISGETRIAREGHPSRRVPDSIGVRVARGRVFFQWERGRDRRRREVLYGARDAFNGLPLWNVPTEYRCGAKRWQFVAGDGRLFAFLRRDAPLTALDAGTGRLLRTYDRGCRLPADARQWDGVEIRHCAGKLIQVAGAELFVLDASSGRRLWHRREKQGDLHFPVASAEANRLFVAVAEKRPHWSRWPHTVLTAVLCLELATGKVLWRNTEVAGGDIGQLIYDRGSLAVFGSGAIGGGDKPYIGNIRVRDGKLLFHRTFRKAYNRFGYNMLVRDGVMYYCDHLRIYAVDMASGEETRVFDDRGYNQRCNRFSATGDYFIYGLVTYVDRSFTGYVQSITRSGCAIGAVPANGLIYFTPNGCGCIPGQLRGHMALSPEPLRKPLPDAERLTTFRPRPKRRAGEPAPAAAAPPAGPVPADWVAPGAGEALETKPVAAGERKLVAVVHAHRLECRDDAGKVLWSFTAGGRVSSPPVLHDGLVLLGCHDGFVYCLQADDGSPVWRFLAAPYERRIIACGQLESSWPVYGVTMHNGLVCFSAGLHPELGGGIYAYGLEPTTGRLVWRKVLHKRTIVFDPKRPVRILPNRVLNDVLRSDGTQLHLPGLAFRPDEPDEQLRLKVEGDPSKADRRR